MQVDNLEKQKRLYPIFCAQDIFCLFAIISKGDENCFFLILISYRSSKFWYCDNPLTDQMINHKNNLQINRLWKQSKTLIVWLGENPVQQNVFPFSFWCSQHVDSICFYSTRESTWIYWNTVNKRSPWLTWSIGQMSQRRTWPLWSYCWGNIQH